MEYDPSRGNVAIQDAATRTLVRPLAEILGRDRSAVGASLRSVVRRDFDKFGTSFPSFVPDKSEKSCPSNIVNLPSETPGRETLDVQIFGSDQSEPVDQASGNLVQIGCASVLRMPMER